jgi:hypothetical protein
MLMIIAAWIKIMMPKISAVIFPHNASLSSSSLEVHDQNFQCM